MVNSDKLVNSSDISHRIKRDYKSDNTRLDLKVQFKDWRGNPRPPDERSGAITAIQALYSKKSGHIYTPNWICIVITLQPIVSKAMQVSNCSL